MGLSVLAVPVTAGRRGGLPPHGPRPICRLRRHFPGQTVLSLLQPGTYIFYSLGVTVLVKTEKQHKQNSAYRASQSLLAKARSLGGGR